MSYQEFLVERERMDALLCRGYVIKRVHENLSGAFIEFALPTPAASESKQPLQTLHIQTADARKYVSSLLIQQMKRSS
ncbi:hypothetical protein [Anoxybacteroides rupiense]|uniref:hypothetical protein n=1 Tax=Anoxybacteroides rupiense TaxID=311460 RepID=UPI001F096A75